MYEHKTQPLLPKHLYIRRLIGHILIAVLVIFASLLIGIVGYHFTEGLPWLDSLLNASMILGGMGPVNELHTSGGKFFASFYSLFRNPYSPSCPSFSTSLAPGGKRK
jgi:hypothetical protein